MQYWWAVVVSVCVVSTALAVEESSSTSLADSTVDAEPPLISVDDPPRYVFPQRREVDGYSLVLHAPQIRSWPEFKSLEALLAIELTPPDGGSPSLGTLSVTGATEIDMARRIVTLRQQQIGEVIFSGEAADEYEEVVTHLATRSELDIPLDLFLAQLADDVLSDPPPPGFNTDPPVIHVASTPTLLLLINGTPVLSDVADTGVKAVVNANWPVFQEAQGGAFYLLNRDLWLTAPRLDGAWKPASSLPRGMSAFPEGEEYEAIRAAVPLSKSSTPVPTVIVTDRPEELIVSNGEPTLEAVPGAGDLEYVSNTESPLFRLEGTWYFLVAGRWFTTSNLDDGLWRYQAELPEVFGLIPEDHAMASVLASVPGTVQSRMAALEALLPTTKQVARDAEAPVEVTYAGEPRFEPIPDTEVSRAANSGYDVIQYGNVYYLCYSGIWYEANAPIGPWVVAAAVPDEIYAIPPSSPSYHVTQVTVAESSPTTVIYTYPPAYSSSVYVVYGVPYYGTGWYYPPYIYGPYYYPYWGSYGHGSWYNPVTGGYGSRSVWYGPYGGYSYTQGYNPRTGRYGYMETAWDGDEWGSHSETYNPRTGISTETSRYYDEDRNKSEMDRRIERGDKAMEVSRDVNWDEGTSQTKRETSSGASSNIKRQYEDGTVSSSGTIETADGRTFDVEGERTRQGGSGTITGEQGSAELNTQRNSGRSVTSIEGSEGGKGVSVSGRGPGRTTIAESGSGDLYAGHNGNVFKKTDDGWQKHENGGWNPVDAPERSDSRSINLSDYQKQRENRPTQTGTRAGGSYEQRQQMGAQRQQRDPYRSSRDLSQLNRDHSARQRGNRQFQQRQRRAGGMQRGGVQRRGGGMRRRR
jgi:hypothetical protein